MKQISKIISLTTLLTLTGVAYNAQADSAAVKVFAPKQGDVAGVESRGFLVDLRVRFKATWQQQAPTWS